MRVLLGVAGVVLIALMLAEFFVTFLLPRRVKRDPRIARRVFVFLWRPWRSASRRMRPQAGETMLGFFGPLGLLAIVALWSAGLILGFAMLHSAHRSEIPGGGDFGNDLVFSAGAFFSAAIAFHSPSEATRLLAIFEAVTGYTVLFVVIGYLPALFQAFSRREVAVSQLDPRAGSPPSASSYLQRSARLGGWREIDDSLVPWETWAAELMETHLSYPVLAYYRSQHVNQNWLAALTTVLDVSAFAIAAAPEATPGAEMTFAIARHAVADLTYTFRGRPPQTDVDRLSEADLHRLTEILGEAGLECTEEAELVTQLAELRAMYEPYVTALSASLALDLPAWVGGEERENWRRSAWRKRH